MLSGRRGSKGWWADAGRRYKWAAHRMGHSSFHLSAPFQEPRLLCGCYPPAPNSWNCALKRRRATHFIKVVITQSWKGLLKLKKRVPVRPCVLWRAPMAASMIGSPHSVTFISHFDKDMGALMDGTFQRKDNTSKALEIHYWMGGGQTTEWQTQIGSAIMYSGGMQEPTFPRRRSTIEKSWSFKCMVLFRLWGGGLKILVSRFQ